MLNADINQVFDKRAADATAAVLRRHHHLHVALVEVVHLGEEGEADPDQVGSVVSAVRRHRRELFGHREHGLCLVVRPDRSPLSAVEVHLPQHAVERVERFVVAYVDRSDLHTADPRQPTRQSTTGFARRRRTLELAKADVAHRVVGVLAEHQGGATARWLDVVIQIGTVDGVPDPLGLGHGLRDGQMRVTLEV